MRKQSSPVEYHPPTDEIVGGFVRDASLHMAAKGGDKRFLEPEVTWGFAAFIKLVGAIRARQLNAAYNNNSVDKNSKPRYPQA
jgi:hypothetical protein